MLTDPPADSPFEVLTLEQLRARSSAKWSFHDPDVIPAWVAEMDLLPPPEVIDALTRAIRAGDTGYPGMGEFAYAEAFAEFAARQWGWAVDVAASTVCADAMSGIVGLLGTLLPPEAPVVVPSPVYPPFALFSRESGRRVVQTPLTPAGRLDLDAIDEALAPARAYLLLCSPHNPTGVVHTEGELRTVAQIAEQHGATVIADEVHGPLVHGSTPFVPWLSVAERGFTVTSAAKGFNLAGLKAAVIMAAPADRAQLQRLPTATRYGASHLGILGHAAAYRADPAWLVRVNAAIAANAARLQARLAERLPSAVLLPPEATYLAWVDCHALALPGDPAEVFLERGRVGLTSGAPFGRGGQGHVRINIACSAAVLDEVVARMVAAVRDAGR
jgi:cysteine-S-conjugate beta-lyase